MITAHLMQQVVVKVKSHKMKTIIEGEILFCTKVCHCPVRPWTLAHKTWYHFTHLHYYMLKYCINLMEKERNLLDKKWTIMMWIGLSRKYFKYVFLKMTFLKFKVASINVNLDYKLWKNESAIKMDILMDWKYQMLKNTLKAF